MNERIRNITDELHNEARARYALALDVNYHAATVGMSKTTVVALRHFALAILGSPYLRVTNRRWNEDVIAWLASLAERYAAQQEDGELYSWPCQQLHGGAGAAIYANIDGLCQHPECHPKNAQ